MNEIPNHNLIVYSETVDSLTLLCTSFTQEDWPQKYFFGGKVWGYDGKVCVPNGLSSSHYSGAAEYKKIWP